jgi:transcriptional regulator with XRE-family HTH domain
MITQYEREMAKALCARAMGRCVREAREAAGLTQLQLGRAVGVTQNTMTKIECGEIPPSVYVLSCIAEELDTTLDDLCPVVTAKEDIDG